LIVRGNTKQEVRHQHRHLKWQDLILAQPKGFITVSDSGLGTNQRCGCNQVSDILINLPKMPEAGLASTSALSISGNQCNRLSYTGVSAPRLMMPGNKVDVAIKDIGYAQPFMLDSMQPGWKGRVLRITRPISQHRC